MKLIVVRHGESILNHENPAKWVGRSDSPLSESGKKQAEALRNDEGFQSATRSVKIVYSSPLKRAKETASIISGIAPIVDRRIIEMDYGIFEMMDRDEIQKRYAELWKDRRNDKMNFVIPGGESYSDVEKRVRPFLEDIKKRGDDSLVVSHASVIKIILKIVKRSDGVPEDNIGYCSYLELKA